MFCRRKRSLDVTPQAGGAAQTMNKRRRNASTEPARRSISAHQRRIPLGQLWYHLTMTGSLVWGVQHVFSMPDLQPDNDLKSHPALPGSGGSCDTTEGEWPCEFPEGIPKTLDTYASQQEMGINLLQGGGDTHILMTKAPGEAAAPQVSPWKHHKIPAAFCRVCFGNGRDWRHSHELCYPLPPESSAPEQPACVWWKATNVCAHLAPSKIFTMLKESFSGPRKIKPPATPHNEKWGAAPSHLQQALLDCLFVLFFFVCFFV